MSAREDKFTRSGKQMLAIRDHLDDFVQWHSRDQRVVLDGCTVVQVGNLVLRLDLGHDLLEGEVLLGESLGDGFPDSSGSISSWESESSVRSPVN